MVRPLLLLDVDGVLQPAGASIPPGYERHTTPTSSVVLSAQHGEWLTDLNETFEIVWATTWGPSANEHIGPHLGLPTLAHLELGQLPRDGTRKLAAVRSQVGDRPLAWIDDELYDDASAWATQRGSATLLVRTSAYVGMTRADYDELKDFARRL